MQARIVDHVLAQWVADQRITNDEDVAYWRRRIDYFIGHGLAYQDEHREPVRWDETHAPHTCRSAEPRTDAATSGPPR